MKVIRFTASWCGPCRMYKPVFDEVEKEMVDSGIVFQTVDIDEDKSNRAEQYAVRGVPTTVLIKENEVVDTIVGVVTKSILKKKVEALL
jgi:thioredoxin 1